MNKIHQTSLFEKEKIVIKKLCVFLWLSDDAEAQIISFKLRMETTFGQQRYSGSKPHITLYERDLESATAYRLGKSIAEELQRIAPLSIKTKGFTIFQSDSRRTLVAKVDEIADFEFLDRAFKISTHSKSGIKKSESLHITIGQFAKPTEAINKFLDSFNDCQLDLDFVTNNISISLQDSNNLKCERLHTITLHD